MAWALSFAAQRMATVTSAGPMRRLGAHGSMRTRRRILVEAARSARKSRIRRMHMERHGASYCALHAAMPPAPCACRRAHKNPRRPLGKAIGGWRPSGAPGYAHQDFFWLSRTLRSKGDDPEIRPFQISSGWRSLHRRSWATHADNSSSEHAIRTHSPVSPEHFSLKVEPQCGTHMIHYNQLSHWISKVCELHHLMKALQLQWWSCRVISIKIRELHGCYFSG